MDQKIAVLYARYSSDKQTEQSIEGQISEINRFAEYQGYKIINHYIDRAISGRTDDRPSFLKMVQDSYNKEFQYVIVYKLDRFSRDRYVSETYKHILGLNGVRVISATENISDKPDGILMESMLIGYSEYYSKELAEKVKRGNKESRKKGQYTGGACIYGYKIKDKHYVIDEYESNVVKEIFESILKGLKLNDIATLLNTKGISTNNGYKWSISKIRRIIRNEKYIGIAKFNDEVYTNIVPPIIDKDLFDKANSVLDKNKHVTRDKRGEKYYLTNKLVDSITKASYIGRSSNKCNMNYRYYECKDNNAYFRRLKKSDIETKVIEQVCNYFSNEDNIHLNNAGKMLFSNKKPITLKMAVFATNEKKTFIDMYQVEGNIFELISEAEQYVKKNIKWSVKIDGFERIETPEVPVEALREIIINSFAHANYIGSSRHEIDIHPNRIAIYNPGSFPDGLIPEDFRNKDISSKIRNELICNVLFRCGDVESWSTGLRKVYDLCDENGVNIGYEKEYDGFWFFFKRDDTRSVTRNVTRNNVENLTELEKQILAEVQKNPKINRDLLSQITGRSSRHIQRALDELKRNNLIERVGSTKGGYWKVNDSE